MALLELKNVHTYYGNIHALKGLSINVDEGEIVTLIGANGAGKSTTLKTICGLTPPSHGEVWLGGQRLDGMKPNLITEMGVTHAPEGRKIFNRMTVQENLEMGAYPFDDRDRILQDMRMVYEIFPRLEERKHQQGGTLSGGEQQMLAIARALMGRPRILLLDEPSMGLAPLLVATIFETIQNLNKDGVTILLVEQNALAALSVADRGYVLQTGEVAISGSAGTLREDEMVRKVYLGEA